MMENLPPEIDISPVEFELPEVCVSDDEMVLIIDIKGNFRAIELLHRHVLKSKRKGVLPNGIVRFLSNLNYMTLTGVFSF